MRLSLDRLASGLSATVAIERPGTEERLELRQASPGSRIFESSVAPQEPHEFVAALVLSSGSRSEMLPFQMHEPAGHKH